MAVGKASVIGANLKFNRELRTVTGLAHYLNQLGRHYIEAGKPHNTEVRVYPHDLALIQRSSAGDLFMPSPTIVGAQDIHFSEDGSFTRAPLSAKDIRSLGVRHTLIGHSETRVYYGVKDADVAKKLEAALKAEIFANVCVGENIDDKQSGRTLQALEVQVKDGILPALKEDTAEPPFYLSYEPVYAIAGFAQALGLKAIPPQMSDIQFAHESIRGILAKAGFTQIADHVRILYGGSAKPENTQELLSQPYIDGLLVGTASWDVQNFISMIQIAETVSQPQAK